MHPFADASFLMHPLLDKRLLQLSEMYRSGDTRFAAAAGVSVGCAAVLTSILRTGIARRRRNRRQVLRCNCLRWELFLQARSALMQAAVEETDSPSQAPKVGEGDMVAEGAGDTVGTEVVEEEVAGAMVEAIASWRNGNAQRAFALTDVACQESEAPIVDSPQHRLSRALLLLCKGQAYAKLPDAREAACFFLSGSVSEASKLLACQETSCPPRLLHLTKQAASCCSSGLAQISMLCSNVDAQAKYALAMAASRLAATSPCMELDANSALALAVTEAGTGRLVACYFMFAA